ncbi:MAG: glycosyltransferase family 2 protein [Planctomycetota bacterium]
MRLDLVIPARNEAANLPALIEAVDAARGPAGLGRVVLADNGSTDGTGELARAGGFEVVREDRPGYGGACLAALRVLAEDPPGAVAFLDADLADDPAYLAALARPIAEGRADLVLGQRNRRAESGALDPHQRFGNALATTLLRLTCGRAYRDLGPMRALRWESYLRLEMADRTWGWTVEMQHKAAKRGLRIEEIDVPYRKRQAGRSKISGSVTGSAKAGVKIIAVLGRLWWKG